MPTVAVGIPTHSLHRRARLELCIDALLKQGLSPSAIFVAVDSNRQLLTSLAKQWPSLNIFPTSGRGVCATRNTILAAAHDTELLLFLDDDVIPDHGWHTSMVNMLCKPGVAAVGGRILPSYQPGAKALPPEILWLVGCTYAGHPTVPCSITRPIGAAMGFRTTTLTRLGGFDVRYGPIGLRKNNSNEELALAQRIRSIYGPTSIWYEPTAIVHHYVPSERCSWAYLLRRCWVEGASKANIRTQSNGSALNYDRSYLMTVLLPSAASYALHAQLSNAARVAASGTVTGIGYLTRRALSRIQHYTGSPMTHA